MTLKQAHEKRVMVLGASSWLGVKTIERLSRAGDMLVSGSVHKSVPEFPQNVKIFQAETAQEYRKELDDRLPQVVINYLRGEDVNGLEVHAKVIEYCENNSAHYIYASSSLALDGYKNTVLGEAVPAKSITPYGKFKAECETDLANSKAKHAILRISSLHGWAQHKTTRTESFLAKLRQQETIYVDRGVWQNRMYVGTFVECVMRIIAQEVTGVLHLGAAEGSEEYVFLQNLATAFGYSTDLIKGGKAESLNVVLDCFASFRLLGFDLLETEERVIAQLTEEGGLASFKKNF